MRHAEHRIVSGIQFEPFALEPFGGPSLVGFTRIRRSSAPDNRRRPLLAPEAVEFHRCLGYAGRVRRIARKCPRPHGWLKVGEQALLRILAGWTAREAAGDAGGTRYDVANALTVEQG